MASNKEFNIFLVDDDTKHLLLLKEHLVKKLPYKTHIKIFSSGENVLDKLPENPDVIILDYYLDAINERAQNGLEILKQIKKRKPKVPVVMMSNQDKLDVAIACLDNGANDYIIKNETAFLKSQIIVRNLIEDFIKEKLLQDYRTGLKIASGLLVVFFLVVVGLVIYVTQT